MSCLSCSYNFGFQCVYFNGLYTEAKPWLYSEYSLLVSIGVLLSEYKAPQCRYGLVYSVGAQ